ncbi:hypothetical protein ABIE41_001514 [Bosea sp. OAE506]|uniref:hypothetical protein n=1 Tax=Bosea sp. OAE506 TaxID=2663870 RepID=UPI00178A538A
MATRGLSSDEIKLRAQRAFDKVDARKQEASRAFEAEQLAREAVLQKTARLKALRLAKEAADAETAAIVAAEQIRAKVEIAEAKAAAKASKAEAGKRTTKAKAKPAA